MTWTDSARCATEDGSMDERFFALQGVHPRKRPAGVMATCASCPVLRACLGAALDEEAGEHQKMRFGIRGGTFPVERFRLDFETRWTPEQRAEQVENDHTNALAEDVKRDLKKYIPTQARKGADELQESRP